MGNILFKNGDSTFQNGNSLDIFESKTNLPLYSQMNSRKCKINLLFFPLLKVKKIPFLYFCLIFNLRKKGITKNNKLTKNQHNLNYEQTEIDILVIKSFIKKKVYYKLLLCLQ